MPQSPDQEDDGNVEFQLEGGSKCRRKSRVVITSVVSEIMGMRDCSNPTYPELNGIEMSDEVQSARSKQTPNSNHQNQLHSENLQLQFLNKPSSEVLTGRDICGDRSSTIQVVLVDGNTGLIVRSGPEASAEVEIGFFVVKGALDNGLIGDVRFNLENGIGYLLNVHFKHTKVWTKKCELRLTARITDHNINRVAEGQSETFTLLDKRVKLNGKRDPPTLSDEIWRLRAIQKDGPFHGNLNREQIWTVKDLLILLNTNQQKLKNILGPGFHASNWNTMVNHALNCETDQSLYLYWSSISPLKVGVVFNSVGLLTGLLIENEYMRAERLSTTQKDEALQLIRSAFSNSEKISYFDDEASLCKTLSDLSISSTSFNTTPDSELDNGIMSVDLQQTASSSETIVPSSQDILPPVSVSSWNTISDKNETYYSWSKMNCSKYDNLTICDTESMIQAFAQDDRSRFSDDHINISSSANADISMDVVQKKCLPKSNRAHRRWKILYSVMKWVSVRKKSKQKPVGSTSTCEQDNSSAAYNMDEHLQLLESESNEDRESAVNEILRDVSAVAVMNKAQRKYVPKRDKARRNWRVLSSVIKLCSLSRPDSRRNTINGRFLNGQTAHFGFGNNGSTGVDDDDDDNSAVDFLADYEFDFSE